MRNFRHLFLVSSFVLLVFINSASADPVVRQGADANAAQLPATVKQFRADLGGALNPNNGQSFLNGRREVNWDGVPDQFSEPNNFPVDFFNVSNPRGVIESGKKAAIVFTKRMIFIKEQ